MSLRNAKNLFGNAREILNRVFYLQYLQRLCTRMRGKCQKFLLKIIFFLAIVSNQYDSIKMGILEIGFFDDQYFFAISNQHDKTKHGISRN